MAANKIEGSITLIGMLEGTTLNGFLRVDGNPLVQRFNKGTNVFIPDFEASGFPEDKLPTAVVILRETSDGDIVIPQVAGLTWKYNGIALSFGEDGLCTSEGLEGIFKKINSRPTIIDGKSYNLPALQVRKNLVPISGYDNDRLSVSGSVEMGGNAVSFSEISKEVIIQEMTGNAYAMSITDDKGFYLVNKNTQLTAKCNIYKDGNELSDYSGVTFKWEKLLGTGTVQMGTARTQVVNNEDVNNTLLLRCTATISGETISEVVTITDVSDPYEVHFDITGVIGRVIRKNETATIKPIARKRSDASQTAEVASWAWSIIDNEGKEFTLSGKSSSKFSAASAQLTFADMERAKMSITCSVTSES